MKTEFIPYEQALALKELGFDEVCFAKYKEKSIELWHPVEVAANLTINSNQKVVCAPLYQQAFRWFREKHKVTVWIIAIGEIYRWNLALAQDDSNSLNLAGDLLNTYEEAELACLKKLIEIVKEKKS